MIALEVRLNGQRLCVAGADDLVVLTAALTITGGLGSRTVRRGRGAGESQPEAPLKPTLHVGGMTSRGETARDEHLRWCRDASVSIGDTVELRLVHVEATAADAPAAESTPRETSERYAFERAKAKYLALRDKYEARDL
jgi:hypothetical protein